jgi:serine protease inhibitor
MNEDLHSWLNEQTNGRLQEQVQNVNFDPLTVLALATTIDYQVQWVGGFTEKYNTQGSFHSTKGDTTETFMRTELTYGPYYWSEHFGAIFLPLEDGSHMWLILPDEGIAPEEIADEVMAFLADPNKENRKSLRVNVSLPKFDVVSQKDIVGTLQQLGVTDVFQSGVVDFSPILPEDDGGFVSSINHAARVMIDEEGITAAAFTVILRAGAGMPPDE